MGIWDKVVDVALDVGGAIIGGFGDDEPDQPDRSVQPSTTSLTDDQTVKFVFDEAARDAMKNLTSQMQNWSETDRTFFEDKFMPFQQALIDTNMGLLENISKNSNLSLEQSMKDLAGGEMLKNAFRANISDLGGQISDVANRFAQELEKLPTEQDRIGQAVSRVEQTFGQAGAEIRRKMAAQGINVTQATERSIALQKAQAKAGAVGAAGEQARRERMDALSTGAGVFANLQAGQSAQLTAQQQLTQAGVGLTPQVGGVVAPDAVSGAGVIGADLTKTGAETIMGTEKTQTGFEVVQPGVTKGVFKGEGGLEDVSGLPTGPGALPANITSQLSPTELDQLKQAGFQGEGDKFVAGTGGTTNLKASNPQLYDKIKSIAGSAFPTIAGLIGGPVAGALAKGVQTLAGRTTTTSADRGSDRGTGSGAGTGGGRGGEHETESDPSGGMGGV
jgi:hypothetical protein